MVNITIHGASGLNYLEMKSLWQAAGIFQLHLDTPDGCLTNHNWDSCELRHLLHGERPLFGAATVAAAPSWFEATHHELLVATGEFYVELRDHSWQRVYRIIENLQIVFLLFDAKPSEASSQIFCRQKRRSAAPRRIAKVMLLQSLLG